MIGSSILQSMLADGQSPKTCDDDHVMEQRALTYTIT